MDLISAKEAYKQSKEKDSNYHKECVNKFLSACDMMIIVAIEKGETKAIVDSDVYWGLDWSEQILNDVGEELGELGYEVRAKRYDKYDKDILTIDWSNPK